MIDPGHGGGDPGAVGATGLTEASVNLLLAHLVKSRLERDFAVVMTRVGDTSVSLGQRCGIANKAPADVCVSLHCNAAKNDQAHGTETYYHPGSAEGKALAELIHRGLVTLGLGDRGVKPAGFYVLKHTKAPAVLVELAFITNPADEARLTSTEFLNEAAHAIAEAVYYYTQTEGVNRK